jgi:hypothetical protein
MSRGLGLPNPELWPPQFEQCFANVVHLFFIEADVTRQTEHLLGKTFADWQPRSMIERLLARGVEAWPALDSSIMHLAHHLIASLRKPARIQPRGQSPQNWRHPLVEFLEDNPILRLKTLLVPAMERGPSFFDFREVRELCAPHCGLKIR